MAKRALLVIDVQKVYTNKDSELYCKNAASTTRKVNLLLADAKRRGDVVVSIRHIHKSNGTDLGRMFDFTGEPEDDFNFKADSVDVEYDERLLLPKSAKEFVKNRYSAFVGTGLDRFLRSRKVDSVTICGFMTNFCCDSTARHAHDLDYFVDFVTDATGTPGTEKQNQGVIRARVADFLSNGYARTWSTKAWCARK